MMQGKGARWERYQMWKWKFNRKEGWRTCGAYL